MTIPVLAVSAFVQSTEFPDLFYTIKNWPGPQQDFYLDFTAGGENVLMTMRSGSWDRGVKYVEYGPAYWMNYTGRRAQLRVRFYQTEYPSCQSSSSPSCSACRTSCSAPSSPRESEEQIKERITAAFLKDFQAVLDKYKVELEAKDYWTGYAECGSDVRMTAMIDSVYDKDGNCICPYIEINLGSYQYGK